MSKFKFVLGAAIGASATVWIAKKSATFNKEELLDFVVDKLTKVSSDTKFLAQKKFQTNTDQLQNVLDQENVAQVETDFDDIHLDESQVIMDQAD
ncbi:hypothetical protein [Bombilactobacillus thymidiniphilus]|uniref:YtxH-like protein n=1 Tax=Bombilactobacillus thymidiniphilus TaxID=2923363 RepID=A0ABY4PDM3_9LACO|nr:hypothetical protein [Bombilactobacillus thymidiniphilus]UQS83884.1 hypothetical protein MOO47_01450 [Bombilactobacillus thymidiniphilus]